MMLGLVGIMGTYAVGILLIHWLHWRFQRRGLERMMHYVLVTRNNQLQVEWYIRSLGFFSWLKGRAITVTLVDEGSTDETLSIVARLSEEHQLHICSAEAWNWDDWVQEHENEQVVVVRLSQNEGLETAYKFM
ncbi:hypothetical protein RAC89_12520 [Paenibacillus sp. GD4]|jgi:hypothetical protein|uniref:hypothetical protein n=1 Tax=Paenibacillus sp. GD4 TaxID=3068890 RepID=UPI002796869C|nr:hypothetical protein [Paenibacillus sp. GD4]MDQ1911270.1 hypothetical protein [Paenibacillus sp. GD4]